MGDVSVKLLETHSDLISFSNILEETNRVNGRIMHWMIVGILKKVLNTEIWFLVIEETILQFIMFNM